MASVLFILGCWFIVHATASDGPLTCYDFEGYAYPNNTQCQGSFSCCGGDGSGCTANRFCESSTGALIVPACSRFPWVTGCSNICQYCMSYCIPESCHTSKLTGYIGQLPAPGFCLESPYATMAASAVTTIQGVALKSVA